MGKTKKIGQFTDPAQVMLKLILDTFQRLRYSLPANPRQVQIEITNRCNMDCPMCPREVLDIELEHMNWDKFITVVDKLTERENITLTGWGEPFLHPRIFGMIAYCKKRGHRVMTTSNGLFSETNSRRISIFRLACLSEVKI